MHVSNILAVAIVSVLNASSCSAACARPVLQTALEGLFKTIEKSSEPSIKVASNVKISRNNIVVGSVKETGLSNFTRWAKPFRITVLDEATCNVVALSVPKFGNQTQLLSTRMQVTPTGETVELEVFFTGKDTNSVFFGDYLPDNPPDMWAAKHPAPREALVKSMDAYASAITAGDGNLVKVAPNCTRYENGFKIGGKLAKTEMGLGFGACDSGFALIKVPVVGRRWYVDSGTGVGFGNFNFSVALWLHEFFKVEDGKIMQIFAAMQPGFKAPKDPWTPPN